MDQYKGAERRRHKRIKKNFITKFKYDEGWEMVTARNLGAQGILFNFNKEIPVGSQLEMAINFPTLKDPIRCTAEVLRVDMEPSSPVLKIAGQFMDIAESDKQAVDNAAENFYSNRHGKIEP